MERAGGRAHIQVSQTIHNETSLDARESTRATRYGFDFQAGEAPLRAGSDYPTFECGSQIPDTL